jgi:hypothetical protein
MSDSFETHPISLSSSSARASRRSSLFAMDCQSIGSSAPCRRSAYASEWRNTLQRTALVAIMEVAQANREQNQMTFGDLSDWAAQKKNRPMKSGRGSRANCRPLSAPSTPGLLPTSDGSIAMSSSQQSSTRWCVVNPYSAAITQRPMLNGPRDSSRLDLASGS